MIMAMKETVLKLDDFCKGCKKIEPTVLSIDEVLFQHLFQKVDSMITVVIGCAHSLECQAMMEQLKTKTKENK